MTITWNDSAPIYRQLRERVVAMILDGALHEGDSLPPIKALGLFYDYRRCARWLRISRSIR